MSNFKDQRAFRQASDNNFFPSVGADYVMIIEGYEALSFAVKTHQAGALKNDETIEYSTIHGVKTGRDGYLQTWNVLPLTFIDDMSENVMNTLDAIKTNGSNNYLKVAFFKGRTIDEMSFLGIIENGILTNAERPDADNEATTAVGSVTAELKGHWFPKAMGANPTNFLDAMGGLM